MVSARSRLERSRVFSDMSNENPFFYRRSLYGSFAKDSLEFCSSTIRQSSQPLSVFFKSRISQATPLAAAATPPTSTTWTSPLSPSDLIESRQSFLPDAPVEAAKTPH